jgi:divinyl protochlorophyllide a 8-vinyl-reductase
MGTLATPHPAGHRGMHGAAAGPARIGPNAIIQVFAATRERMGTAFAEALLADATPYRPDTLPSEMVVEDEPRALVRTLVERAGPYLATSVLREAGLRTGDYLLANRIPRVAQWVMRASPKRVALRLLLGAMRRNAWTFAGSGRFVVPDGARTPELVFEECAMCRGMHEERPMCDFYAGTFERLVRALVSKHASVTEVECMAQGAGRCRFVVHGID